MTLYLNHVFSSVRLRGFQKDDQDFVYRSPFFGVDDLTVGEAVGSERQRALPGPEQCGGDRFRGRAANPDNPYATLSKGGGNGGNGIFVDSELVL